MPVFGFMNDEGALTNRTREFYLFKTIQKAFKFMVMFDETDTDLDNPSESPFQNLSSYHAVGVDFPSYAFQKEQYKLGNLVYTFPTLNHEGFVFSIKFEEDNVGSVQNLINSLTRRIISPSGYYNDYNEAVVDRIVVDIFDEEGTNVWKVVFENCYFLKADGATYDFSNNDKITYNVEFNADHYYLLRGGSENPTNIRSDYANFDRQNNQIRV